LTAPSIETALAGIQEVIAENQRIKADMEQMVRTMEILRQERDEAVEKNKKFAPYEDILLDEKATEEPRSVYIRSPITMKQVQIRSQQLFQNTSPMAISSVVENALSYALSNAGWMGVTKNRFANITENKNA